MQHELGRIVALPVHLWMCSVVFGFAHCAGSRSTLLLVLLLVPP